EAGGTGAGARIWLIVRLMLVPPDPMLRLGWPPIIPLQRRRGLDRSATWLRCVNRFTLEKIFRRCRPISDCRPPRERARATDPGHRFHRPVGGPVDVGVI